MILGAATLELLRQQREGDMASEGAIDPERPPRPRQMGMRDALKASGAKPLSREGLLRDGLRSSA